MKYGVANPVVIENLNWFPYLPLGNDAAYTEFNLNPIRPRDILTILKHKNATSAPGPDGLMYGVLRKLPSTHHLLATLFSKLLVSGDPPLSWSRSNVTLIHKSGDTDKPENFRMISLTSCVGKLFHQILSERIAEYFLSNKLMDPETQKAFLKGINGCVEHTFVMNELLANARSRKRTLHVTFFDLADAFGSVEHNLIHHTMERNKLPNSICLYIQNLYSRLEGEVLGPGWQSAPFNFRRGVFQGDPLSPIIFLAVFDPIIQHLKLKEETHGYDLEGKRYITLPFADDFCLLTSDKRKHQKLMTEILDITSSMNLTLKPIKCKTMSIRSGSPDNCTFTIGDNVLKSLQDAPEKFLGSTITFRGKTKETFDNVKDKLIGIIDNIDNSQIRNEYKVRVFTEYAIPSLRFMLTVHELCDTQLQMLDHIHTNAIKKWLGLSINGATPAVIHSPDGLAFPRLSDVYLESHCMAYARCMVKADTRVTHALTCKLDRESQWVRKMHKNGSRQWQQTFTTASDKVSQHSWSKIKPEIKNIIYDDRVSFWQDYIRPLLQQGNLLKLLHLQSSDLTWRSMIYNLPRGVLSFAVRATIDFLPTFSNLRNWGKRTTVNCKLCGNKETLSHVLNSCPVSLEQGRLTWRHNTILSHIIKLFKSSFSSCSIFADIPGHSTGGGTIPPDILVTKLKPDMVVIHDDGVSIDLIELTVPFETNIDKAHEIKQSKYTHLVQDLEEKGFKCQLFCLEIGSRGLISKDNEQRLQSIFQAGKKQMRILREELSRLSLLSSYTIWNARHNAIWEDCPYIKC